jgi:WD40 repeat protein
MIRLISTSLILSFIHLSYSYAQTPKLTLSAGHSGATTSISFSPDGKFVLTGNDDHSVKLWNVNTGDEIRTFSGHTGIVNDCYFLSGSDLIVSASLDKTIIIWNMITGEVVKTMEAKAMISSMTVTHDSKYAATGDYTGQVFLWDLTTGNLVKTFKTQDSESTSFNVQTLCFSPDDKYIVSGSDDKTLKLWDISSGEMIRAFIGHTDVIRSVCFSPDRKTVISASEDGTLKVWDIATGKEIKTFRGHRGKVFCVSFSNDGRFAVSGGIDEKVKVWDIEKGLEIKNFYGNKYGVHSVCFSPDDKTILSAGYGAIRIWDIVLTRELAPFASHSPRIVSFAMAPDGQNFLFGEADKTFVWNLHSGKVEKEWNIRARGFKTYNYSANGLWLAAFDSDWSIRKASSSSRYEPQTLFKSEKAVSCVDVSTDGAYVLFGGDDKEVKLLDVNSGDKIKKLSGHTDFVSFVKFLPDGKMALSASGDLTLILWDLTKRKKIKTLIGHKSTISCLDISPDGKWAVSAGISEKINIWDLTKGEIYKTLGNQNGNVHSVCFSTDSKSIIAEGINTNDIVQWDIETGKEMRSFKGHSGDIAYLKFMPDGKRIVSFSRDMTMRLWDIESVKELATVYFLSKTDWIASTPDGFFDGNVEGIKKLYYVKGLETIPLESLYEQFYTPKLLSRILNNEKFITQDVNINQISQVPRVKIISPENNSTITQEQVKITVKATDKGGGIDEIRLYHNGKLLDGTTRGFKSTGQNHEFTVTLTNGENRIKATAFNSQRTESIPDEIVVYYKAPEIVKPNMHILAVGINNYLNPKYNLNYAKNDADAFVKSLSTGATTLFGKVEVTTIYDANATKTGILAAIEKIKATAKAEDVFVFYYAGHGVMSSGNVPEKPQFYLVPHDVTKMYEADEMLKKSGISATEIGEFSKTIKAQKQLFVIDACQSGGAMQTLAMRGAAEEKAIAQLARSTGTYFIAASGTEQFATEVAELGHGIFTYSVIEALKGSCKSQDGKVTVNLLKSCVEDLVPELSKKHKGQPQFPTGYGFGMDFPVVMVQ